VCRCDSKARVLTGAITVGMHLVVVLGCVRCVRCMLLAGGCALVVDSEVVARATVVQRYRRGCVMSTADGVREAGSSAASGAASSAAGCAIWCSGIRMLDPAALNLVLRLLKVPAADKAAERWFCGFHLVLQQQQARIAHTGLHVLRPPLTNRSGQDVVHLPPSGAQAGLHACCGTRGGGHPPQDDVDLTVCAGS
jgi:hypothetical protein